MKHRKQILVLSVLAALALVSFFPAGGAWAQGAVFGTHLQDTKFTVAPFTNDGSVITELTVLNTGESGSDLCANIYLFTPVGQMTACCACPVKQNGLLELSIADLAKNPVTGMVPTKGVIKVVGAAYCYPAYVNVAPGLRSWQPNTHGVPTISAVPLPPIPVPDTPLGDDERLTLMRQCQNILTNGAGLGICSCPAQ
jgi:hypothetical protein